MRVAGLPLTDGEKPSFWESTILPRWVPLLIAAVLGVPAGSLIAAGEPLRALALVLVVPAAILIIRYPFAAVLLWLLLFPYFVREGSASGRLVYWGLHRGMIPIALGCAILARMFKREAGKEVRFGPVEVAMLLVLGLALANIFLLTPRPSKYLINLYDRLFIPFCMYWLVRFSAPSGKDLRLFVPVAFATVISQSAIGLLSWFAPSVVPSQWLWRAGERTVGTFGNPAVYTSTLIFLSLFLLQYAEQTRRRWIRWLCFSIFALAYFCVFFSFSRGSWLGGALVLLGLVFVYPKLLRLVIPGLVVMVLLSGNLLSEQRDWAIQRLYDMDTAEGRVVGGATGLRMIQAKPLLGWGYNTYDTHDEQFKDRVGEISFREEQTSHNTYLLIAAELGIAALVIYLFPAIWLLALSLKVWRRLPTTGFGDRRLLVFLWLLILDHFTVSNFMDMFQANMFGTTVWWMALGLIATLVYSHVPRRAEWAPRPTYLLARYG